MMEGNQGRGYHLGIGWMTSGTCARRKLRTSGRWILIKMVDGNSVGYQTNLIIMIFQTLLVPQSLCFFLPYIPLALECLWSVLVTIEVRMTGMLVTSEVKVTGVLVISEGD